MDIKYYFIIGFIIIANLIFTSCGKDTQYASVAINDTTTITTTENTTEIITTTSQLQDTTTTSTTIKTTTSQDTTTFKDTITTTIPEVTTYLEIETTTSTMGEITAVTWIEGYDNYIYTTHQETTIQQDNYYTNLSNTEFNMICAVVQAEANSGSLEFKEYIAGIIYNRIKSDDFPNTVYEVLTQDGQFGSINNYYSNSYPVDNDTKTAVTRIFSGQDSYILSNLNGAVSYCNPNLVDYSTLNWFESTMWATYQCSEYINGITWVHRFYALK